MERTDDELERLEGVGPALANALRAAGIRTFAQLAAVDDATKRAAVSAAGFSFAPSLPTWSRQARLLADGDEAGFRELTERLTAGRPEKTDTVDGTAHGTRADGPGRVDTPPPAGSTARANSTAGGGSTARAGRTGRTGRTGQGTEATRADRSARVTGPAQAGRADQVTNTADSDSTTHTRNSAQAGNTPRTTNTRQAEQDPGAGRSDEAGRAATGVESVR